MKPDAGHRETDALLANLEKKISREHAQGKIMEGKDANTI